MNLHWRWYAWPQLDADTLYAFLKLRSDIFVVEQNCAYADIDGLDPSCLHLCGRDDAGQLRAYLRLLPPGLKVPQPALGRLVVDAGARSSGIGRQTVLEGLRICKQQYPQTEVFLSGQQQLLGFYASLGFRTVSEPYLDDGIWHLDMLRAAG